VVLPLGVEGHGVPGFGVIPGDVLPLLPWLPGVGLELDDPEFGVEPEVPFALPGTVPQGELLGDVPGVFGVLGLTVDGCVVLPGVELFGDVDPGVGVSGVSLGEVEPGVCPGVGRGVAVPACGVAVLAGGVAVLAGGVAGEPGVELWPAPLLEPPEGAPAPGELWATAQLPQHNTTVSNISFRDDMFKPPGVLSCSSFVWPPIWIAL
jgi:hypothetical protein